MKDSTTIQGSLTQLEAALTLVVDGYVQAAIQVTGENWSGTLVTEATINDIDWFTIESTPIPASFTVQSVTANGEWVVQTAGYSRIRVRMSAFDVGSAQVTIRAVASGDTRTTGATDDSAMPATPPFLPVGGEYRSSATTYTDGDATVLQTDVNGNLKTTLATAIAGEDLTNDVLKVEQRFSGSMVSADTLVKTGAGFIHTLTFACIDAVPTAGTIIVYDNTAESGTILYSETFDTTVFRGYSVILDLVFSTGLYIGFATTADIGCTPSYR